MVGVLFVLQVFLRWGEGGEKRVNNIQSRCLTLFSIPIEWPARN